MTHEPECPWRFEDDCYVVAAGVTFCEVIRSGYRRGREDAANNLGAFIAKYYYHFAVEIVEPLLATARGDGEQA